MKPFKKILWGLNFLANFILNIVLFGIMIILSPIVIVAVIAIFSTICDENIPEEPEIEKKDCEKENT